MLFFTHMNTGKGGNRRGRKDRLNSQRKKRRSCVKWNLNGWLRVLFPLFTFSQVVVGSERERKSKRERVRERESVCERRRN